MTQCAGKVHSQTAGMEELSTAITAQPVLIVILLTDLTNCNVQGAGGANPPPRDDLRFSNTTGILQKKKKKNYVVYWC